MTRPLLLLLATLTLASAEDLTTTDGKTYTSVTVTKVELDGLRIVHASGTAFVPFAKLPEDLQKKYGYNPPTPEQLEQARKAKLEAIAKAEAARVQQQAKDAKTANAAKEYEAILAMTKDAGRMSKLSKHDTSVCVADGRAYVGIVAPHDAKTKGTVAAIAHGTLQTVPVMKGKMNVGEKQDWVYSKTKILGYVEGTGTSVSKRNDSDTILTVDGEQILYPIGQVRYIALDGNTKTVLRFTTEQETAIRFYKKHGPQPSSCENVIIDLSQPAPAKP